MPKNFRDYRQVKKTPDKATELDRVRSRQKAERAALKKKQSADLERGREVDFKNQQAVRDRKRKEASDRETRSRASRQATESIDFNMEFEALDLSEVLEVGTKEIVDAYSKVVPGQDEE